MGFSTSYGALCATRFLLGLFEGKLRELGTLISGSGTDLPPEQPLFFRSSPSLPVSGIGDLNSPFVLLCG